VIWARRGVGATLCPKSQITGDSAAWLELYHVWKRLGFPETRTLSAREAHAMLILEQESEADRERN